MYNSLLKLLLCSIFFGMVASLFGADCGAGAFETPFINTQTSEDSYCYDDIEVLQQFITQSEATIHKGLDDSSPISSSQGDGVIQPWELGTQDWVDGRLESWVCNDCGLSGQIPTGIQNMTYLQSLSLPNNNLSGSFPSALYNLSNLSYLNLSNNLLSGGVSEQEFCEFSIVNFTSEFYCPCGTDGCDYYEGCDYVMLPVDGNMSLGYNYFCEDIPFCISEDFSNYQQCEPEIIILSPEQNEMLLPGQAQVHFEILNFEVGSSSSDEADGHFHYTVDGNEIMKFDLSSIRFDENDELTPGAHTLEMWLVGGNHIAIVPDVRATVNFTILKYGCTDENAINYDNQAQIDRECEYIYPITVNEDGLVLDNVNIDLNDNWGLNINSGTVIFESGTILNSNIDISVSSYSDDELNSIQALPEQYNTLNEVVSFEPHDLSFDNDGVNISIMTNSSDDLNRSSQPRGKVKVFQLDGSDDDSWEMIKDADCNENSCSFSTNSFGLFWIGQYDSGCNFLNFEDCSPSIIGPRENENLFPKSVTLYWESLEDAVTTSYGGIRYNLEVYLGGGVNGSNIIYSESNFYGNDRNFQHTLEDLDFDSEYFWRINALYEESSETIKNSNWTESTFYTIPGFEPPQINMPENSSAITPDNITLSWESTAASGLSSKQRDHFSYGIFFWQNNCCDTSSPDYYLDDITNNQIDLLNSDIDHSFFKFNMQTDWAVRAIYDNAEGYRHESDWSFSNFRTKSISEIYFDAYNTYELNDLQWHVVGFPFNWDSYIDGSTIFQNEQESNNQGEPTNWAIYEYNRGDQSSYSREQVYLGSDEAYFLYSNDGPFNMESFLSSISENDDILVNTFTLYDMNMEPGWNLVSWPNTFDSQQNLQFDDSILSNIWFLNGGNWDTGTNPHFMPFEGFAIYNKTGNQVRIGDVVNAEESTTSLSRNSKMDWELKLEVYSDTHNAADRFNYIGVSASASNQLDQFDEMNPPAVGGGIDLSFIEADHELSADIKNIDSDYYTWELKLNSGIQSPIKLAWKEVVNNQDYTAFLHRPKNGQIIELEISNKQFIDLGIINDEKMYIFAGTDADLRNRVELLVQDIVPAEFSLYEPYPNPFNPRVNISFGLPDEELVSIQVYDMRGNLIETLMDQVVPAGFHHMHWDASAYSSGIYLISIHTTFADQTRKITFLK